jgi:cobyrinic acid a,c-diamide synthase
MYLCEAIVDLDGVTHPMAGLFPTQARMQPKLAALGYTEVEQITNNTWLRKGERIRGHEFRYSEIDEMPQHITRNYRLQTRMEGFSLGSVLASYIHLHFASCPEFAHRFVLACTNHTS